MKIHPHLNKIYRSIEPPVTEKQMIDNKYIEMFDSWRARPICSCFSQQDIEQLEYIAISPSYSSKLEKDRAIGEIMNSRGFQFFHGGTNRRVFYCTFDPTIIAIVAYDETGLKNNKDEFLMQDVFKPYCCKVFEVTPNGAIAFEEKVDPILDERDFQDLVLPIADIIIEKIYKRGIGISDIGSRSFKNWGVRPGFGPVLLDFPTASVMDRRKLFCHVCGGTIDYDIGFDKIICLNCGREYNLDPILFKKDGTDINKLRQATGLSIYQNQGNGKSKGVCTMKISLIKDGRVIHKDLSAGRSDIITPIPQTPVYVHNMPMSEKDKNRMFRKVFGYPRHDLKVRIVRPEEPVEDKSTLKVKDEFIFKGVKIANEKTVCPSFKFTTETTSCEPEPVDPIVVDTDHGQVNVHQCDSEEEAHDIVSNVEPIVDAVNDYYSTEAEEDDVEEEEVTTDDEEDDESYIEEGTTELDEAGLRAVQAHCDRYRQYLNNESSNDTTDIEEPEEEVETSEDIDDDTIEEEPVIDTNRTFSDNPSPEEINAVINAVIDNRKNQFKNNGGKKNRKKKGRRR